MRTLAPIPALRVSLERPGVQKATPTQGTAAGEGCGGQTTPCARGILPKRDNSLTPSYGALDSFFQGQVQASPKTLLTRTVATLLSEAAKSETTDVKNGQSYLATNVRLLEQVLELRDGFRPTNDRDKSLLSYWECPGVNLGHAAPAISEALLEACGTAAMMEKLQGATNEKCLQKYRLESPDALLTRNPYQRSEVLDAFYQYVLAPEFGLQEAEKRPLNPQEAAILKGAMTLWAVHFLEGQELKSFMNEPLTHSRLAAYLKKMENWQPVDEVELKRTMEAALKTSPLLTDEKAGTAHIQDLIKLKATQDVNEHIAETVPDTKS